jgi:hypothetical protein
MKSIRILVLAAFLAGCIAALAGAAGISLQVGATAYDFNALGANQGGTGSGTITNSADFSPDPYLNASYLLQLDPATKLTFGLMAEDMMGIDSPAFIQVGRIEPYADFSMGALTARVSFPMYLMGYDSTNDGKNALITYVLDKYYKGINLGTYYNTSNTFQFTNYESVAWRLNLDKTTAFVFSASTEITFSPDVWLNDVKPQVTFIYGPVQLDVRESIYFADQETTNQSNSFGNVLYNLRVFTDPTLTFNFASIGVAGLKIALGASLFTCNVYPNTGVANDNAFYGNAGPSGGKAKALGSSITPSISYSNGPFAAVAGFKYSNYDDSLSNAAKKDPTFDPSLKLSYTFSF